MYKKFLTLFFLSFIFQHSCFTAPPFECSAGTGGAFAVNGGTVAVVTNKVVFGQSFPYILNTVKPSGYDPVLLPYSMTWESSPNGSTGWVAIAGATGHDYTGNAVLTQSTYYRRKMMQNGEIAYSNVVLIAVETLLNGGHIGVSQLVAPGVAATPFTNLAGATGSTGTFAYQWESSTDQTTWLPLSGAVSATYSAGAPATTTYYRRKVTSGIQVRYSNTVRVTVQTTNPYNKPATAGGTATQPEETLPDYAQMPQNLISSVVSYDILKPGILTPDKNALLGKPRNEVAMSVTYVDGMLRPIQQIDVSASKTGKDIVLPSTYDKYGRQAVAHMAYAAPTDLSTFGTFRSDVSTQQPAFLNVLSGNQESHFFSKNIMEESPLNRYSKTVNPGKRLAGMNKGSVNQGRHNTVADDVRIWTIGTNPGDLPQSTGVYAPGKLWVLVNTDAENATTYEYLDMEGNPILHVVEMDPGIRLCTYYVYDEMQNQRYAMNPIVTDYCRQTGAWSFSGAGALAVLKDNSTRYEYDRQGRNIIKALPGSEGEEWMVYDGRDRLVFSQNPLMRSKGEGEWLMYLYDAFDRPLMIASYKNVSATRESLQTLVGTTVSSEAVTFRNAPVVDLYLNSHSAGTTEYVAKKTIELLPGFESETNANFEVRINENLQGTDETVIANKSPASITGYQPLTVLYYDNYSWTGAQQFNNSFATNPGSNPYPLAVTPGFNSTGRITGMKTKVLGTDKILSTTYYYDEKGNHIQTLAENITGGIDITTMQFDFSGKLLAVYHSQTNLRSITHRKIDLSYRYEYNTGNRLTGIYLSSPVGGSFAEKKIAGYDYDELGRISTRELGTLETLNYTYSLQGPLKGINEAYARGENNSHYFGVELGYESGFTAPRADGMISGVKWRRKGNQDELHAYGYVYDDYNRLTDADYSQKEGTDYTNLTVDYSGEYSYDANGNITLLKQTGVLPGKEKAMLDQLEYRYENTNRGNRLLAVKDYKGNQQQDDFIDFDGGATVDDYSYDQNGNLTSDKNRKLIIENSHYIDKPSRIYVENIPQSYINFLYTADGDKLEQEIKDDGVISRYTFMNGFVYKDDKLMLFRHPEGRMRINRNGIFVMDYFISDHLNNTRTVLTEESNELLYKATHEDNPQPTPPAPERDMFSFPAQLATLVTTNPLYDYSGSNRKAVKLNGTLQANRIGTGKVLKVMAGDVVQVGVMTYYPNNSPANNVPANPVEQMLTQLIQLLLGPVSTVPNGKDNVVIGNNGFMINKDDMEAYIDDVNQQNPQNTVPKAYLNYVLFDENFEMVSGSALRVSQAGVLAPLAGTMNVQKNGYVYVYVSNDSPTDVYFDDLAVKHITGPLLQEDTYYPYGGSVRSQSSIALNRMGNVYLFNGAEKISEFDLDIFDTQYRTLDPQTARWWQQDPMGESFAGMSPYNVNFNNPVNFTDPDGDLPSLFNINPWLGYGTSMVAGAVVGTLIAQNNGGDVKQKALGAVVGAAAGLATYYGLSVVNWQNIKMPSMNFPDLKMPKLNFNWLKKASSVDKKAFATVVLHIKHGFFDRKGMGLLNHFNGHTLMDLPVGLENMPLILGNTSLTFSVFGMSINIPTPQRRFVFDFINGDVPLKKPAPGDAIKNELKTEWLSQGEVLMRTDSKLNNRYMEGAKNAMGYTKIEIGVTKIQYEKLMNGILKSHENPPKYGFVKTRCAGWASQRLREAGVFNQFSRLFSWSPLPLRFAIRLGLKFGTNAKVTDHTAGKPAKEWLDK